MLSNERCSVDDYRLPRENQLKNALREVGSTRRSLNKVETGLVKDRKSVV